MKRVSKALGAILGAACIFGWGFVLTEYVMPDQVMAVKASVASVFRDYSVPLSGEDGLYTITDQSVPLAGPSAVSKLSYNGWLQVRDGKLVNEKEEPVQLRGMSSHGLAWFPEYTSLESIRTTRDYGANLFRVAMYVDDTPGNYTRDEEDQRKNKEAMYAAIDNTLSLDMYVIADWHIREDGNPMNRVDCAVAFFDELSQKYADEPGVIYEISSDPNGDGTTWHDVYRYTDCVVPVIRKNAPGALIIIGTLEYSSDLAGTLSQPVPLTNVMYAYHYNSGVHKDTFRATLEPAIKSGLPIITTWALGGGDASQEQATKYAMDFLDYIEDRDISWASWSLANKDESFSAIAPEVETLSGWTPDELTVSGKIAFSSFAGKE